VPLSKRIWRITINHKGDIAPSEPIYSGNKLDRMANPDSVIGDRLMHRHGQTYGHSEHTGTHPHTYQNANSNTHIHAHTHIHTHAHIHVCTCGNMHAHMTHMKAGIYTCMHLQTEAETNARS